MEETFALGTLGVVIIAAVVANINVITVGVDSEGNVIGREIFIALRAKQIFVVKATGTNVGAVVHHGHLPFVVIFFAMLAKAIVFVQAMFTDVDALAVPINDFPSFGAIVLALLAEFGSVVAVGAEKPFGEFGGAGNAKSISADLENLEIVGMILADRNLSVEVGMRPVRIAAKTTAARDTNVMLIAAIFFSLPEIGDAFKLGEFALNQIAIKL